MSVRKGRPPLDDEVTRRAYFYYRGALDAMQQIRRNMRRRGEEGAKRLMQDFLSRVSGTGLKDIRTTHRDSVLWFFKQPPKTFALKAMQGRFGDEAPSRRSLERWSALHAEEVRAVVHRADRVDPLFLEYKSGESDLPRYAVAQMLEQVKRHQAIKPIARGIARRPTR